MTTQRNESKDPRSTPLKRRSLLALGALPALAVATPAAADGWKVIPPTDLAERMAAKIATGVSICEALGELAAELENEPLSAVPICKGVGTVTHIETMHGGTIASLAAYCDGIWHSIMWAHAEAAPDWEITPAEAADADLAAIIAVYERLTAAISGRRD